MPTDNMYSEMQKIYLAKKLSIHEKEIQFSQLEIIIRVEELLLKKISEY